MNINDKLSKYASAMEEIKLRDKVIRGFLSGQLNAMYALPTAESIALQLRKTLETIALASLVANKEEYAKARSNFMKDWHANRILNDLESINSDFYPVPTQQIIDQNTGKVTETKNIETGFLTKKEFIMIYEQCGGLLHAFNPYGAPKDINKFLKDVPMWMSKIVKLLNHHQVQLINEKQQLWVVMNGKDNGRVQVSLMERVGL